MEEGRSWLSKRIGKDLKFRDYEIPVHGVASGEAFDVDPNRLGEIANWFGFGFQLMNSPGDDNFDQPYFYINPYGAKVPENLPALASGNWADTWTGAVLTANEILEIETERHDDRKKLVSSFFAATIKFVQPALYSPPLAASFVLRCSD